MIATRFYSNKADFQPLKNYHSLELIEKGIYIINISNKKSLPSYYRDIISLIKRILIIKIYDQSDYLVDKTFIETVFPMFHKAYDAWKACDYKPKQKKYFLAVAN